MKKLVLASTSPYRRELLGRLGLPFEAVAPRFDEQIYQGIAPEEQVQSLALGKALSLADDFPDAVIIGSDQVFVAAGEMVGKPGTAEKAFEQLKRMSGASHTFYTGLAVADTASGENLTSCVPFTVTLRSLADEEIRNYIRRENPLNCAGSFMIEGLGIALMEKLEGTDFTALIGLPLIQLVTLLRQLGINPLAH
ncbi:MAG: septum formation inhibitor Maf [Geobacter sp.]|nr:MAG: septum formation inhibitor Maf [Geobacter sp.]